MTQLLQTSLVTKSGAFEPAFEALTKYRDSVIAAESSLRKFAEESAAATRRDQPHELPYDERVVLQSQLVPKLLSRLLLTQRPPTLLVYIGKKSRLPYHFISYL